MSESQDDLVTAIAAAVETDNSPSTLVLLGKLEMAYQAIRSLRNAVHNLEVDNFRMAKELKKRKRGRG